MRVLKYKIGDSITIVSQNAMGLITSNFEAGSKARIVEIDPDCVQELVYRVINEYEVVTWISEKDIKLGISGILKRL